MHQTTIRFAPDLWGALVLAAEEADVSVAQYVRDAALIRLVSESRQPAPGALPIEDHTALSVFAAHERSAVEQEGSAALWAQSQLARARSEELRRNARDTRGAAASREPPEAAMRPRESARRPD
jgi:hypothetical protein